MALLEHQLLSVLLEEKADLRHGDRRAQLLWLFATSTESSLHFWKPA